MAQDYIFILQSKVDQWGQGTTIYNHSDFIKRVTLKNPGSTS